MNDEIMNNEEEFSFSPEMFEQASTIRTLNNIKKTLNNSLKRKYGIVDKEVTDALLKMNGLHIENFDFVKNIEDVISSRLNDVSLDDNSNKNEKTISGIAQEIKTAVDKAVGYDYLYRVCKELYGRQEAKKLMGSIYDYSLGLNDSSKILYPYCYAIDASKLVIDGRNFGVLPSGPAKRVSSYMSGLCETIHQLSNHVAGAIAIGSFFLDLTHILVYKEKISFEQLKTDKALRKNLENEFQQFVHSVNHLSRNAVESPFTNISVFDRSKLNALIDKDNMGWYFSFDRNMSNIFNDDNINKENYKDQIIEYIMEIQKIFLDFFDKGDPLNGGRQYRFPVVTLNISKQKNDKGEFEIADRKFLRDMTKYEIYRYNIFSSEGTKIASCCRLVNNEELMEVASLSNSFGGTALSLGSHRVVTTNFMRVAITADSMEDFYNKLSTKVEESAEILVAHKKLIRQFEKKGLQQFITNGWLDLDRMFSTFGVLGIVECVEELERKFGKVSEDLMGDILKYFNDQVNIFSKKYCIAGNIEQVPAESFAVRLSKADRLIFGEDKVPYKLYANQFVPLWRDATIYERMEIDGLYNSMLSGGGIVHFTIAEKVTSKQAEKLIEYAIKSGCEHFALNAIYSECSKGHNTFGKSTICPVCGEEIVEYYTRVVGFFVPVSSWNKERREWEFPNRVIKTIE